MVDIDTGTETPVPKKRGRKPGQKNKVSNDVLKSNDVSLLIQTVFNVSSTKFGEHWKVTQEEANSIAEPLTRILNRMGQGENVSKYSDYVVLLIASCIVIIPRIMVNQMIKKQRRNLSGISNEKRKNTGSNRDSNVETTSDGAGSLKSHLLPLS